SAVGVQNFEPLPIDQTINFATQIAEGLQAAHAKGIIHRDIKSSNIIITDKGQVKIMDFGLAKVRGSAQMTKVGTTLGTAAYMSPEQARGDKVDQRTDIWAFGVVLYETLTGQLPFGGYYAHAVLYSIQYEKPKLHGHFAEAVDTRFQQTVALKFLPLNAISGVIPQSQCGNHSFPDLETV
ncbi:MAG: serine/threonine protein kinase, partial [bacterium]